MASEYFRLLGRKYFCGSCDLAAKLFLEAEPGSYVHVSNVHTLVESFWNGPLASSKESAFLSVPDGRPLAWAARLKGWTCAQQVRGADLMLRVANAGVPRHTRHFFYGGAPGVAQAAAKALQTRVRGLKIAGVESPPFRPLSDREKITLKNKIRRLKVDVLWVGLGAPKQELWMKAMSSVLPCKMAGVGAAFNFFAGNVSEAPLWMQRAGLEWLFRFFQEPQRLWKRYLKTNPVFLFLFFLEYFGLIGNVSWAGACLKLGGLVILGFSLASIHLAWVWLGLLVGVLLAHVGHRLDRLQEKTTARRGK